MQKLDAQISGTLGSRQLAVKSDRWRCQEAEGTRKAKPASWCTAALKWHGRFAVRYNTNIVYYPPLLATVNRAIVCN